ncbi:MAG: hypothetical protein A2161_14305 [Candidatus Schekmanbacteria bacterium RBG_13_48_7]|uniref:NapC/NirT cytochrome c N-terminal domain-containing protein n=1 Tax=Candidatus Schekmanbacteria bacterium RBG_13_48_7 TaxID=1817878 RepID=A0A1F7RUJ2_9BACT|nr:MAG: hypothetical protein A2161_14305 [Candidatus Schekmanbacteria bacterium RBG_13_48_7]
MLQKYINFIKGISVNWFGRIGVILTTSSFISFILIQLGWITGILNNAYIGLITYLMFPSLFILGLILIPAGWFLYRRTTGKTTNELLNERFDPKDLKTEIFGSSTFLMILFLTSINILFMGGASIRMLHFMDQPRFCGTACHSVMNPEWTTYNVSPHARVKCVQCHVGEGFHALLNSKINGMWQMVSITFSLYEKPIPTPIHQLRPARETCEKCHWPEKFYGNRLKTILHYSNDYFSVPVYTTLNLKIDTEKAAQKSGIHWHIGKENEVRYTSADDKRKKIIWVESKKPDGTFIRYNNIYTFKNDTEAKYVRTMDCVDCHNRATHIYENPESALDKSIHRGLIDRSLPYIRRESLTALTRDYSGSEYAVKEISNHLHGFYSRNFPDLSKSKFESINEVVKVLSNIYKKNIHPQMNITWGSYPSFIGHKNDSGCFRCHNENLIDRYGQTIPYDCTLCHSILANGDSDPLKYLKQPSESDPDYPMQLFLGNEFLKSLYE